MLGRKKRPAGRTASSAPRYTREELLRYRQDAERRSREAAKGPMDLPFLLLLILLLLIGLAMLFSASFPSGMAREDPDPFYYIKRQAVFALGGFVMLLLVSKFNYKYLRSMASLLLAVSIGMLVLVLIPGIGQERNNATRWLGVGGLTFQPSEVAKVAIIIYYANWVSRMREKMEKFWPKVFLELVLLGIVVLMILFEPHLSGAILTACIGFTILAVGGMRRSHVATLLLLGGLFLGGFYFCSTHGIISYGQNRIAMWENPFTDPQGEGYQMCQSLLAIGSGGLFGVGFGRSRQKFNFLPEEHNDFIFPVICEELGMVGACIIMLIFAMFIIRGFWIAIHARDRFGKLLVVGIMAQIGLQTFMNIGVVTGLLPATGISLPFFSYGGTALMTQLMEMGIVLSVSRQIPGPRKKPEPAKEAAPEKR